MLLAVVPLLGLSVQPAMGFGFRMLHAVPPAQVIPHTRAAVARPRLRPRTCRFAVGSLLEEAGGGKINVVLTHTTADFDTLAAAVGLVKVWKSEDPNTPCYVCVPRGSHPTVAHFLALHKNMYPIKSFKEIDPEEIQRVGMVDAQKRDRWELPAPASMPPTRQLAPSPALRVGPAARFLDSAEEVHIYDHHMEAESDVDHTLLVIEEVGSVSTIVTEMLQDKDIKLMPEEATLLALGVHSDTGSLTYESATARDAKALAWLMENGASQQAIAEFGHAALSPEQQELMTRAFSNLKKKTHKGVTLTTSLVESDSYINGMAASCQNLLEVTDSDVMLLGSTYPGKKGKAANHMSIIGRAKARVMGVDLNAVLGELGGGGHPKAAAVSFRLDDENIPGGGQLEGSQHLTRLVDKLCEDQIVESETAGDIMTAPVLTCSPDDSMEEVKQLIERYEIRGIPVVKEDGSVAGLIGYREVKKAEVMKHLDRPVKGWMRRSAATIDINEPLQGVEQLLVLKDAGQLPVLEEGKLVGLITRTDLLRQHSYYDKLHYHNKAFAEPVNSPQRKMLANLRKQLKKFDHEE